MELRILVIVLLVAFASLCAAIDEDEEQDAEIQLLRIVSDIRFRFARTRITGLIVNPLNTSTETSFDVTLPNSAYITNFTLELNGEISRGRIEERFSAHRKYTSAKQSGSAAGHVSKSLQEANKVRIQINVPAQLNVTCNLTYEEVLERRQGSYRHHVYVDVGQPVTDVKIDVVVQDVRDITTIHVPPWSSYLSSSEGNNTIAKVERIGSKSARVSFHPTPEQQLDLWAEGISGIFTVMYDLERKSDGGDLLLSDGQFIHFFAPTLPDRIPTDVLFILDTSDSMYFKKLGQVKEAMKVILSDLTSQDTFNVLAFGSFSKLWRRKMAPVKTKTITQALDFIEKLEPAGWTDIQGSMETGFEYLTNNTRNQGGALIIYLTDGRATSGEVSTPAIEKNIKAANGGNIPLFTLAFGHDADWELMKKLSLQNHGTARRIYSDGDPAKQIEDFYQEVGSTLLHGLHFNYSDEVLSVNHRYYFRYAGGSELVVVGSVNVSESETLQASVSGVSLSGNTSFGAESRDFSDVFVNVTPLFDDSNFTDVINRMSAYLNIREMLKKRVRETVYHVRDQLKQEALKLSLKFGFVTSLTSLVVEVPDPRNPLTSRQQVRADYTEDEDLYYLQESAPTPDPGYEEYISWQQNYRHRYSRYGWNRGGGYGDPHFMLFMDGLEHPICFDVKGEDNGIYQLVQDPQLGLAINGKMRTGRRRNKNGSTRSFIVEIGVVYGELKLLVTTKGISVDGMNRTWNQDFNTSVTGAGVFLKTVSNRLRRLSVVLDYRVRIDINLNFNSIVRQNADDHLDIELGNQHMLSPKTDGILGQFVHKQIRLESITYKDGYLVGSLKSRTLLEVGRGKARLFQRRDPVWGDGQSCWLLKKMAAAIFDGPSSYYIVQDIFQTKLF